MGASELFGAMAAAVAGKSGVGVVIGSRAIQHFTEAKVTLSLDAISTFEVKAPFDPESKLHREAFRPGGRQKACVSRDGSPLVTGMVLAVQPSSSSGERTVTISGYSQPGILADSCLPPSSWSGASYGGKSFKTICKHITGAFGLELKWDSRVVDWKPRETKLQPEGKPWEFLVGLAKEKGVVLCSTAGGALWVRHVEDQAAASAFLEEGCPPVTDKGTLSLSQRPQEWYSDVTVISRAGTSYATGGKAGKGAKNARKNPHWSGEAASPCYLTVKQESTDDADVAKCVAKKLGRMLANYVEVSVPVASWFDASGNIWQPGSVVRLTAPGVMVYAPTNFLIKSVELSTGKDGEVATLKLILPGTYDGTLPSRMPWETTNDPLRFL